MGDVLGTQARTILKTHLQNSGRFSVLDRKTLKLSHEKHPMKEKIINSGSKIYRDW